MVCKRHQFADFARQEGHSLIGEGAALARAKARWDHELGL